MVFRLALALVPVLFGALLFGQQAPFVAVTGPNAPKGATFLFEDSRGGMWMGGVGQPSEGLTYFDGNRFVSPVKDFPKVWITGMAEDSEGGIWIAASDGIYRFFKARLEKKAAGFASKGIAKTSPDVFLAAMNAQGESRDSPSDLVRISKEGGSWHANTVLQSVPARRFLMDHFGNVLYYCTGGFCEIRGADVASWRKGSALLITKHPQSVEIDGGTVMRDGFGCVWGRNDVRTTYQCPGDALPTALPLNVASMGSADPIQEFGDGTVAITSINELAIGRPGHFEVFRPANGYPSTAFALVSKDDSLWLSNANGLFLFRNRMRSEFWTEREGIDGTAWSVLPDSGDVFAISSDSIRLLDKDRSRWQSLAEIGGASHLAAGPERTILVSSRRDGVVQLSRTGTVIRRSDPAFELMVTRTGDGQIWTSEGGISKLVVYGRELRIRHLNHVPPGYDGSDLKPTRDGRVWGCYSGGLISSSGDGRVSVTKANGLLENTCNSLAVDQGGDVWFAYASNPAFSLIHDPARLKPAIHNFIDGPEIGTADSNFIDSDSRGWLWRGTEDGIYVADLEQARLGQWLHLNRSDGLPSTDSNQRSFVEDKDGSVWFGAGTTITHLFPPADLVHPRYSPAVFVSGFSFNGGAFQMANVVDAIQHGADIVAHIGSLQFDRRNALRLRYRLLPDETAWRPQKELDISLGELPWGKHTLEVQGRLYTGPWSGTVSQSFTVLKPFWLTSPALLGYAAMGSLAGAGGYGWRRRRRQRDKTRLPALADWRVAVLSPEAASADQTLLDDRFEVGRLLARGGFAKVFEGRDRRSGLPCAVKIFRHELLEKSWMARRFQQEVSALQQIHHPNIVRIHGHGNTASGAPYLVMEFVEGKTLRDVLGEAKLDRLSVASYLRQTGTALAEIHAHRICHRDLKPENLMIRTAVEAGQDLVLIDFSIAIVQDPDETIHGLSRAAGTLQYMAPEQAIGYADASSDIYSLAKILLEMLTGERLSVLLPDASLDLPARIREFLSESSFGLSEMSIDLLARALEFDPARRPRDAGEFAGRIADDLEA